MTRVPVYFSHSYRREDRHVNDHFWRAFYDAGFSFTVDPESTTLYTTTLELMMARSVGFVAVVTFRPEEERYQCSPFILYEYGLAVQTPPAPDGAAGQASSTALPRGAGHVRSGVRYRGPGSLRQ